MRSSLRIGFAALVTITSLYSCSKTSKNDTKPLEIRNVTIEATVRVGEVYNLDLSFYGTQHATCRITQNPANTEGSLLTVTNTNPFTATYAYRGSSGITSDRVIIQVLEDDGNKGDRNGDKQMRSGTRSGEDKASHPAVTNITILLTVHGSSVAN